MNIGTVSLNQIWEDKQANFIECKNYIEMASTNNIDLVIFPEMTLTGFSTNIELTAENEKESETIQNFIELSQDYSIAILFGLVIRDKEKVLNKSIFVDKGKVLGLYSKIHPFTFAGEDEYFNSGDKIEIVKFKNHNIGLSICYDLRFPELYSALSKKSDIIINIANWPQKRIEHWNTLLKARAIENQLFMVGVNRVGKDGNGLEYEESSNIYNVNGELLKFEIVKDMKIYKINKSSTKEFKSKFNTTDDRKIEFYKGVI